MVIASAISALAVDYDRISLSSVNTCVVENQGAATVSVVRAGSGTGECSAWFSTVHKTSFPVRDYVPVSGRVEFAEGQTLAEFAIPIVSNTVPNPTRSFGVVLGPFSNCEAGVETTGSVVIADAQAEETMAQDFELGLPPGWSITTNADANCFWRFDGLSNWENESGGRGNFAIADNCNYIEPMDTEFRTPPFQVAVTALTYLVFKTYYIAGGSDIADVDVSGSGVGGPWTNLWRKHIQDYSNQVAEVINLTPVVKGQSNVVARFHYYNATNEWYWEIDDVAILVEPDSNTNGLPDWWETMYYGGLTNLDPQADSDEDGASNEAEFVAGTHPVDNGSCFKIKGIIRSNQAVTVTCPTEIGHYYDLLSGVDLQGQSWTNRALRVPGTGSFTNLSLLAPASGGFYRMNVHRW